MSVRTQPSLQELTRLEKTYSNGQTVTLYAAKYANQCLVDEHAPKFFATPHGKRETVSYHRSGFVVSATDVHCSDAPLRRRSIFLLVWDDDDKSWDVWSCGSCSSVRQGKAIIDRILDTGRLED